MSSFPQSLAGSLDEKLHQVSFEILKHLDLKEMLDLPVSQAAVLHGWLCCYVFTEKGEKDPCPNHDRLRPLSRDLWSN